MFDRIHCLGFLCAMARIGTMVGVTISDSELFQKTTGPAFAGSLSIIAAILSRLLPDLTSFRMLESQQEIEREQFPIQGHNMTVSNWVSMLKNLFFSLPISWILLSTLRQKCQQLLHMTVATVSIYNFDFFNFHEWQDLNFEILKLSKWNWNFTVRFQNH